MAWPATSNFNSPERGSAWWQVRVLRSNAPPAYYRCSGDGYTFVRSVQGVLRSAVPAGATDWNGQPIRGTDVTVDGRWGPVTSRALWAALRSRGAIQPLLDVVEADAGVRRVSWGSVKAALWLGYRAQPQTFLGTPGVEDINVTSDTIGPPWAAAPPFPVGGESPSACVATDSGGQPLPAAPPPAPTPTRPSVPVVDIPDASVPDGASPVPSPVPLNPSASSAIVAVVGIGLVGLLVVGFLASGSSRGGRRRRR